MYTEFFELQSLRKAISSIFGREIEKNYIRNEICKPHWRSNGYAELANASRRLQNIYLLTKSVEDLQLIPTSGTSCTRMLGLFVIFAWQNLGIEADEYIAIAATGYGEMLRDVQWLIPFVSIRLHLIPQTKKDIEEYEDNLNLTIRPVMF